MCRREHAIASIARKSRQNPRLSCFGSNVNPGIRQICKASGGVHSFKNDITDPAEVSCSTSSTAAAPHQHQQHCHCFHPTLLQLTSASSTAAAAPCTSTVTSTTSSALIISSSMDCSAWSLSAWGRCASSCWLSGKLQNTSLKLLRCCWLLLWRYAAAPMVLWCCVRGHNPMSGGVCEPDGVGRAPMERACSYCMRFWW